MAHPGSFSGSVAEAEWEKGLTRWGVHPAGAAARVEGEWGPTDPDVRTLIELFEGYRSLAAGPVGRPKKN